MLCVPSLQSRASPRGCAPAGRARAGRGQGRGGGRSTRPDRGRASTGAARHRAAGSFHKFQQGRTSCHALLNSPAPARRQHLSTRRRNLQPARLIGPALRPVAAVTSLYRYLPISVYIGKYRQFCLVLPESAPGCEALPQGYFHGNSCQFRRFYMNLHKPHRTPARTLGVPPASEGRPQAPLSVRRDKHERAGKGGPSIRNRTCQQQLPRLPLQARP